MTPQRQFAESVKYTPRPIILIPTDDSFVVMEAYGTRRDYICEVPSDELAQWVREDFSNQRPKEQKPPATATTNIDSLLDTLQLNLDDLIGEG